MYFKKQKTRSSLKVNQSIEGEPIHEKVRRIMHNNEPITDTAPVVYTQRKDGVLPEYDIRTDRFDVALEMTELMAKDNLAKREERIKAGEKKEDASPKADASTDTTGKD